MKRAGTPESKAGDNEKGVPAIWPPQQGVPTMTTLDAAPGAFVEQDDLDRIHQEAVNAWDDASKARGRWMMGVDAAHLAKLTHELRQRRAIERGEAPPPMLVAEPPE